jgi:hypothetical protein
VSDTPLTGADVLRRQREGFAQITSEMRELYWHRMWRKMCEQNRLLDMLAAMAPWRMPRVRMDNFT